MHRFGGTYSQNCTIETPRYAISELHVGKFPDPDDSQCWRVNFKTEVCVSTPFLQLTMSWINEVKMSKSLDDFLTSQSIKGKSFLDFEMLDARIASALRNIILITSFRKRVSVEEQRAQKYNRFLRGRQIDCMTFLATFSRLELSILAYRMMTSRISIQDGTRSYWEWDASGECPRRFVQKKIARFWTTSKHYLQCTTKNRVEIAWRRTIKGWEKW